jgi:hypothetical protein
MSSWRILSTATRRLQASHDPRVVRRLRPETAMPRVYAMLERMWRGLSTVIRCVQVACLNGRAGYERHPQRSQRPSYLRSMNHLPPEITCQGAGESECQISYLEFIQNNNSQGVSYGICNNARIEPLCETHSLARQSSVQHQI